MISELLFTISLITVFVIIVIECWKVYLNNTKLRKFHHVKGWPVIGKGLDFIGKNHVNFLKLFCTENEEISYAWVGPVCLFHVSRPEDFQIILTSDKCLKKAIPYSFIHNDTGLLSSEPNIWKDHRRALNPTLGSKMVNSFVPIFNEKFQKMVNLMERKIDKNVDMYEIMFSASIESITCTSFGLNWSVQNRYGNKMCRLHKQVVEHIQKRVQRVWLWNPIYHLTNDYKMEMYKLQKLRNFNQSVLETKRMELAEKLEHDEDELAIAKENNNQNFLQKCLQMELEQNWCDEDILDETITILIASIDTTSTILNGVTLMLAIHQEYQQRVVNEMHEIFNDINEPVTNEHLSRMTFLELIIKESMRHIPVGAIMGRECTNDLIDINGRIIPKGSQIFLNVLRMHKNPKFYGENAHEFYPERFLRENCTDWHPYQFVPFSAGPRNCIGMRYAWTSLKIALSYILRRFKLTTHLKLRDVIIRPDLLTKIGNENAIRIERREWKLKSEN